MPPCVEQPSGDKAAFVFGNAEIISNLQKKKSMETSTL
jgi:hypothetical protein